MNDVDTREKIMELLYTRRKEAQDDVGALEVAHLAKSLGASARRVAVICSDMAIHGHVDGDGNLMGLVRLSDRGVAYYESVTELIGRG